MKYLISLLIILSTSKSRVTKNNLKKALKCGYCKKKSIRKGNKKKRLMVDLQTDFPEAGFNIIGHDNYISRVKQGLENARKSNVFITGICRNVEGILQTNLRRIKRIGEMFNSYKVFIYENDSNDNTKEILNNWRDKNFIIESDNIGSKFHQGGTEPNRLKDMAFYRNKCLDCARLFSYDYLIVLDLDILGGYSYEGILHSLSFNFDFMGSNSIFYDDRLGDELYYDCFALRFNDISKREQTGDRWHNELNFKRGENIIPVKSCFGGLGIYKDFNYDIKYQDWDCDHVTLHSQILDRGFDKIYLNPSMIVLYNETIYGKNI